MVHPEDVVLSSGGARGILALGAASELSKAKVFDRATSFCGCSIGAVIAAGLVLGRTPRSMLEVAIKHPLEADIAPSNYGLDSGKGLAKWIRRMLALKQPTTLGQVFQTRRVRLVICVCNVTDRVAEYWSHETHPDMDLVYALRVSCSVPLVFAAVKRNGKMYVDGAVADALPIARPDRTLAIAFAPQKPKPIDTIESFVRALRGVPSSSLAKKPRFCVDIDPGDVDPLDFTLDADRMRAAYTSGRRQAARWLKKNV